MALTNHINILMPASFAKNQKIQRANTESHKRSITSNFRAVLGGGAT